MTPSVATRIRQHYAALPQAEQSLADLILSFPGDIAGYTATELARMAGTSNAAVSRFVRRLGFASYDEMRRASRDARLAGSPLYLLAQPASPFAASAQSSTALVERTLAELDAGAVDSLVEALASAPRVWLCGFRHSYFLAGYFSWQLKHLREGVTLLPKAGETLGENMADLAAGDAVLVVAMRRRVLTTDRFGALVRQRGARLFVFTDQHLPDDHGATAILRCHTANDAAVDDHTSVLAMCHLLTRRLIDALRPSAGTRLAVVEEAHEVLGEL